MMNNLEGINMTDDHKSTLNIKPVPVDGDGTDNANSGVVAVAVIISLIIGVIAYLTCRPAIYEPSYSANVKTINHNHKISGDQETANVLPLSTNNEFTPYVNQTPVTEGLGQ